MKITQSDGARLVIVNFPWVFGFLALLLGGGFLVQNVMAYARRHTLTRDEMIGLGFGFAIVLGALAFTRRSVFSFDRATRQLVWSSVGMLGRKGGTIPFHQINGATIETMSSDRGQTEYRVSLTLSKGELPLTLAYSGGAEKKCRAVCDAINEALGKSAEIEARSEESDLRALVASGRLIDAIARVRHARQCSLAEAKDYVESLK